VADTRSADVEELTKISNGADKHNSQSDILAQHAHNFIHLSPQPQCQLCNVDHHKLNQTSHLNYHSLTFVGVSRETIRWDTTSHSQCSIDMLLRLYSWHSYTTVFVCRKNKMSSTNSVKTLSNTLSISSKIQKQMERIITIIKDMENLNFEEELKQLNRLLYRSTDSLMEFELSLRQLKDEKSSKNTQ